MDSGESTAAPVTSYAKATETPVPMEVTQTSGSRNDSCGIHGLRLLAIAGSSVVKSGSRVAGACVVQDS